MTKVFHPQEFNVKPTLKVRYGTPHFNERPGNRWSHLPLNKQFIIRAFIRSHYLTDHAPVKVCVRHKNLRIVWQKKLSRKTESGMLKWL